MNSRTANIAKRKMDLRSKLFPNLTPDMLWDKTEGGYKSMPRTLPHFFMIMDDMSSGLPLSKTYFALWCRSFDEMFLEIKSETEMAFESGFQKQRAIYDWRKRMRLLSDLGFIKSAPGACGEFSYVQILNPYYVVDILRKKNKSSITDRNYNALQQRWSEIKVPEPLESETD